MLSGSGVPRAFGYPATLNAPFRRRGILAALGQSALNMMKPVTVAYSWAGLCRDKRLAWGLMVDRSILPKFELE
jgi:hypothetical protein